MSRDRSAVVVNDNNKVPDIYLFLSRKCGLKRQFQRLSSTIYRTTGWLAFKIAEKRSIVNFVMYCFFVILQHFGGKDLSKAHNNLLFSWWAIGNQYCIYKLLKSSSSYKNYHFFIRFAHICLFPAKSCITGSVSIIKEPNTVIWLSDLGIMHG